MAGTKAVMMNGSLQNAARSLSHRFRKSPITSSARWNSSSSSKFKFNQTRGRPDVKTSPGLGGYSLLVGSGSEHPSTLGLDDFRSISLLQVFPAAAFGLGVWQTNRRSWKLDLIEQLESKKNAAPVPLPEE